MNYLDISQEIINIFFKYFGAKDFVINMQIWVNTKRNEKNLPDSNDLDIDGWAQ